MRRATRAAFDLSQAEGEEAGEGACFGAAAPTRADVS